MNRKIWKALGIAVCMLALAVPRAMAETKVHMVTAQTNLVRLFEEINKTGDDDENVIELHENITLTGKYTLYNCKTTTIKGEGHTIFVEPNAGITVTGKGNVLNLGAEDYKGTLTIDGKTSGGSASGNAKNAFVSVLERATANMYENVTLQNGEFADKACVVIKGSDSAFNMYGGVIEKCSRAVTAESEATFNMSMPGGEIRNCVSKNNEGGGVHVSNATFVMSGGTISGCSAGAGGGLYATYSSKITINKGTISECSASEGGGLYVDGSTLTIEGGTISGCTASGAGMGGGLCAYHSIITIGGGTIENNKAIYGGGVALNNSWINPITNWTVIGNEAYQTKSGNNGGIGGGIYLDNEKDKPTMDISNGLNKIYNNTAVGHGADICLDGRTSSIKLPIAANMGATYLNSGINIDNWYNDNPQYWPSKDGKPVENLHLSGKQSLVASYTVIPVYIEIDANGGVGGSSSQTVHEGTTVTLEAPTREGHLFKGWKDEKGNSYPAGEDGKVKITVTGAMTLTAVWEARTFTVTYVLPDGKTRTETAAYGQNVTLGEEPRTGYTFVGWKDSEKVYHAGETITVTEDKTLTAVWKARTFTVTYVLLDGKTRTETAAYGQNVTLSEEPRTGYTFVGWKDGEKMYHAGETITVTENKTLTAEWKKLPSAENLPKTGDESPVLLWGAALAVSAAACFMLRRRK